MIGVAGCGRMGAPMLRALIRAGFLAKGFDIAPKSNADITTDVEAFADGLETLITVVRDAAQTDQVLFGAQALVETPTLRQIIVSSTLSPRYITDLRVRVPEHIILIDAPMSGAQIAAENGMLSFSKCLQRVLVELRMVKVRASLLEHRAFGDLTSIG